MWNQSSDEKYWEIPQNLANEFLKSKLNMDIIDVSDLKKKVDFFMKGKEFKHTYNSRLLEILIKERQRELRYSFDYC